MTYAARGLGLVASFVLVSTLTASTLAQSDTQAVTASTASPTAAYVYIQTQGPEGPVYGFRSSSTGQLSPIPGSPFQLAGEIIGGTRTKFFTVGEYLIHSYAISSDGAIGSQLSQIPRYDTAGRENECGLAPVYQKVATLDHTGKFIYVLLACYGIQLFEYQTYLIHSDGSFSYDGDTDFRCSDYCTDVSPLSILGNDSFAYAAVRNSADDIYSLVGFRRTSAGTLESMQFTESDPAPSTEEYSAYEPDASPTGNYLVVQLYPKNTSSYQMRFGSYTVDSNGNISSSNTSSNMPVSSQWFPSTTFSPSGDLFVVTGNGIDVYKFNGAAPLTLWQTLEPPFTFNLSKAAFDNSNHFYAFSSNMLHVFTVTSTSVTQASTIGIGYPVKMVVVPKRPERRPER